MAFLILKAPKIGHFSIYILEIMYTYTPDRALLHIFRVMENSTKSSFFENNIFCLLYSKILKKENSRQQFHRNVHSKSSVENKSFLSFKLHLLLSMMQEPVCVWGGGGQWGQPPASKPWEHCPTPNYR